MQDYSDVLILWDLDGTLINGNGAHIDAFIHAIKEVYKVEIDKSYFGGYHGIPDREIIFQLLKKKEMKEEDIEEKIDLCIKEMENHFHNGNNGDIKVNEGVTALLEELERKNVKMGVVTANVEGIAEKKLEILGLAHYMKFGSYGSNERVRSDIVKNAIKKAEETYKKEFESRNIFIIGDTPRDIEAAREVGISVLTVATGPYKKEHLEKEEYGIVIKNLENKELVIELLNPNRVFPI